MNVMRHSWLLDAIKTRISVPSIAVHLHIENTTRYWCHNCKRTFNDLTETLVHQSTRPLAYWIRATFLLCLACSSRRIAREVGVHVRTSYRWCWWLRNAALSYAMSRQ